MVKRRIITGILIVAILAGLAMVLYVPIANWVNNRNQTYTISSYRESTSMLSDAEREEILASAEAYNDKINELGSQLTLTNPSVLDGYDEVLNPIGTGLIGYVTIPSIDIELPIYHGTGDDVLNIGVGHLEGSSFPIGGESTHCVLSAHCGLPTAKMFTDLEEMKIGDTFMITVLNDVLTYEVDQIQVVDPDEVNAICVVKGEDLVTLTTCTPYGINTERLLVRGHRIPTAEEDQNITINENRSTDIIPLIIGIAVLVVAAIVIIVISVNRKRKKQSTASESSGESVPNDK